MSLTVLSVAYPLAAVSRDAAGGAEQILATLDRALVERGFRSIVVAQEGSQAAGRLVSIRRPAGPLDDREKASAQERCRAAIVSVLAGEQVDIVHLHGIDFEAYLPPPGPPVLATLHLPPAWYSAAALRPRRPDTWLNCVSPSQHQACPASSNLLAPIPNGIDVEALQAGYAKRDFALVLGRICQEKGVHLAIAAAKRAGCPLIIAGEVFGYETHRRYFDEEIRPYLDRSVRYVGAVALRAKRRLLTAARCLLIPSLAAETSSLVAREAAACGTPAIGFAKGALPEAIEHGRTGFIVSSVEEMAEAVRRTPVIDSETCRSVARWRFSQDRMIEAYLGLYASLASGKGRLSGTV